MTFKIGKRLISAALAAALIMTWIFLATIPVIASNYTTEQIANQERAIVGSAKRTTGLTIVGSDGTNAQLFKLDSSGHPQVDVLTMPTITLSATTVTLGAGTAAIGKLTANSGVDIGDVTINNATDSAVYVQPGSGATFPATQSGTWNITNISGTVSLPTGASSAALQTSGNASLSSIDTKITACNTAAIAGSVTANAGTNLNTSLLALESGGNLATIAGKDFATQTTLAIIAGAVAGTEMQCDIVSSALPTGAASETTLSTASNTLSAMNAKMVSGTDIGDVTINNAAGAAVYVQPGTSATFQVQSNSANLATETTVATLALETGGNLATIATNTSTIAGFTCNTGAIAGTVTANAGTDLNTSLLALETGGNLATTATNTGTIAGAVAGSEMQVDVVGALPAGTAIIGKVGGGTTLAQAAGASGTNLLAAHGSLKYRIWKLHVVAGNSTTVTLSDSAGVFKTDAGGVVDIDLNPIGILQGTAATAITLTTGDASAFTATVIYSTE